MEFGGIQKLSCLDYPGLVACTVFTAGCNFRCPFCHNAPLIAGSPPETIPDEEILARIATLPISAEPELYRVEDSTMYA